ncbi:imelysin family protein [Gryllotalpicola reticulitermitis]|uniref:Imelysin family protein n=1 Tax=Gryllotalpicola reticulitermitis TaxID=1184153 RepID=A0ABV8Q540_9MICO
MPKNRAIAALAAAVALIVAAGVVVQVVTRGHGDDAASASVGATPPGTIKLSVSDAGCGGTWSLPHGGKVTFEITSDFQQGAEVELADVKKQLVYLDLEGFGPGATVDQTVTLGNGTYRFSCFPDEDIATKGKTVTITDASGVKNPTPGVSPVDQNDLIPYAIKYQKWVAAQVPILRTRVNTLATDIAAGNIAKAKTDWLTAHLTYESMGAAYGTFGDLDDAINGEPAPGTTALADPKLTGFHKVEALLWSGASAAKAAPAVTALQGAVAKLAAAMPTLQQDPNDLGLRAHEIVENAIQFELTGQTDAGSHTNLATIGANLAGSQAVLNVIDPLLTSRYPQLGATEQALAASQKLVATYDHDGSWAALSSLDQLQREKLDASLDQTVEDLAPIASILDERSHPL